LLKGGGLVPGTAKRVLKTRRKGFGWLEKEGG